MRREYSLKGWNLFSEVYKKGKIVKGKGIRIILLKTIDNIDVASEKSSNNLTKKNIKIGISINKKYGKAYIRNKAKRRIKSILHELLNDMQCGFYIIIRPEYNFKDFNYLNAKENIKAVLLKAMVLKNANNKNI